MCLHFYRHIFSPSIQTSPNNQGLSSCSRQEGNIRVSSFRSEKHRTAILYVLHSYPVQLVVESACVADRLPRPVPPPEGGGGRVAVGALGTHATLGVLFKNTNTIRKEKQRAVCELEEIRSSVRLVLSPKGAGRKRSGSQERRSGSSSRGGMGNVNVSRCNGVIYCVNPVSFSP